MSKLVYVYVITDGEFAKVGVAHNTAARCKDLQTGNARRLRVVRRFPFASRAEALRAEKLHHRYLEGFRQVGEWFPAEKAIRAHTKLIARVFL